MKISTVIPAYNAEEFLHRAIRSAFAQTLKPFEVIVIDDGSTDNSARVATELGARVISIENRGVSAARNLGIQSALGDWIALLDADDLWEPEKLKRQAAGIHPGIVLSYTGMREFDQNGIRGEWPGMDPAELRRALRFRNPIPTSSVLMNREMVLAVGGFREDVRHCEDWELWTRLARVGDFAAVNAPLSLYYVYPQSASSRPAKMLEGLDGIIDTTLLEGYHGLSRWAWRRRILSVQLCSAGLIARDNGLKDELKYMFQSLCSWPSPWWEPRRFALFAVSVRNRLLQHDR
ncbi:MAG: glycosyltransferase [Terracidiphilus sp.]|jgi:glycosyltransferase involved in cell wall biosynthesis